MKKMLMAFLMPLLLSGLVNHGAAQAAEPAQTQTPTEPSAIVETAAETEPAVVEGNLYLKTPSVTLSVVGEQEDIYLGLIPRELVTWESDDPSIVSVEGGVLTANGVGTTTIHASYGDRSVSCKAGCLAQTEEELLKLDTDVICAPKRQPPEIDLKEACTYFDKSAIVGDSITYIMFQWESQTNYLGNMLFLTRGGTSLNGFVRRFKNIFYQGAEMNLEDAIQASGVERVYFLIGSNDIGDPEQKRMYFDNWDIMVGRIREKCPNIEIILISNLPQYDYGGRPEIMQPYIRTYNATMVEYNEKLRQYASENGCGYLDLSYYVEDHFGRMAKIYGQDNYHLNMDGCFTWMKVLRYYAAFELEGGAMS